MTVKIPPPPFQAEADNMTVEDEVEGQGEGEIEQGTTLDDLPTVKEGEQQGEESGGENGFMEMDEGSAAAIATRNAIVRNHHVRMRQRTIQAPTLDADVRVKLREFGEPITLFGEGPGERRERLREMLAQMEVDGVDVSEHAQGKELSPEKEEKQAETFYTESTQALAAARQIIARYSLPQAKLRIAAQKRRREERRELQDRRRQAVERGDVLEEEDPVVRAHADRHHQLAKFSSCSSEIGDSRPLSGISFSPCGSFLATPSWSGLCKIWKAEGCAEQTQLNDHAERCTDARWCPSNLSPFEDGKSTVSVATCSADQTIKLWAMNDEAPLATLTGHTDRVNRLAWHPSGRFVASSSFDASWRLWDVEARKEVLLQEGHTKAVYGIGCQPDGSLLASAGADCGVRVWDLRSGKNIALLQGHVKQVLALDWAADGFHFVSGGDDNMVKLWDMRRRECVYTIPAHSHLISSVKYVHGPGQFLATASYDNTVKIWDAMDLQLVHTLEGHENKVLGLDGSPDGQLLATASYDRTWKLWAWDELASL